MTVCTCQQHLRRPVTENLPKGGIGKMAKLIGSCMDAISIMGQLVDHIGFDPGGPHWAGGTPQRILGCHMPILTTSKTPHTEFVIDNGPKF